MLAACPTAERPIPKLSDTAGFEQISNGIPRDGVFRIDDRARGVTCWIAREWNRGAIAMSCLPTGGAR